MNLQYYDAYIEDVLQENKKALHTLMPDCIFRFSVMQYFSHRLFWQNEKGSIVVGDLECNFTSEITVEPVSVFTVTHPSLHPYPGNY